MVAHLCNGVPLDDIVDSLPAPAEEPAIRETELTRALDRKLRGKNPRDLDDKGRARIVRSLVGQGFRFEAVLKRLK